MAPGNPSNRRQVILVSWKLETNAGVHVFHCGIRVNCSLFCSILFYRLFSSLSPKHCKGLCREKSSKLARTQVHKTFCPSTLADLPQNDCTSALAQTISRENTYTSTLTRKLARAHLHEKACTSTRKLALRTLAPAQIRDFCNFWICPRNLCGNQRGRCAKTKGFRYSWRFPQRSARSVQKLSTDDLLRSTCGDLQAPSACAEQLSTSISTERLRGQLAQSRGQTRASACDEQARHSFIPSFCTFTFFKRYLSCSAISRTKAETAFDIHIAPRLLYVMLSDHPFFLLVLRDILHVQLQGEPRGRLHSLGPPPWQGAL